MGFAGWPDFGAEAAAGLGVDLSRTVLVPDPGEHWLEVTAALVDVLRVVVLRPAGAGRRPVGGRPRRPAAQALVRCWWCGATGRGCEARLSLEDARWTGPDHGHGRLRSRTARVAVRRGSAPPVRAELAFPGETAPLSPPPAVRRSPNRCWLRASG